jgi:hypothetical protein
LDYKELEENLMKKMFVMKAHLEQLIKEREKYE